MAREPDSRCKQLYSTANYKEHRLMGVDLSANKIGQGPISRIRYSPVGHWSGADLTGAILTHAET